MPKIYNEIVIDMNPESSTFEETLYEDSFEYNKDDMMLMYGNAGEEDHPDTGKAMWQENANGTWSRYEVNKYGKWGKAGATEKAGFDPSGTGETYLTYTAGQGRISGKMVDNAAYSIETLSSAENATVSAGGDTSGGDGDDETNPFETAGEKTDWGAAGISKEDFINPDGTPKKLSEVYTTLDAKLPGITGDELYKQINKMLPQYQEVAQEEKGFLAEQRGFAERSAGLTLEGAKRGLEGDVYGLQKQAGQVGAQMRGAYGGMGGGMRRTVGGQAAMGKGLGQAYGAYGGAKDAYGLAMDKAEFGERRGLYDLQKGATTAYETGIAGALEAGWVMPTEEQTKAKDYTATTEWGSWEMREGGRVPDAESFSAFLTQLPDAGGM